MLHIERHFLDAKGNTRPLSSLKSGELVMVWLDVWADKNVPDALVVDLLPAGLELENQNLANSSASLSDSASEVPGIVEPNAAAGHTAYGVQGRSLCGRAAAD